MFKILLIVGLSTIDHVTTLRYIFVTSLRLGNCMAKSDSERVRVQRAERLAHGWQEVRVWVANDDDAREIRLMAQKSREKVEQESLNELADELISLDEEEVKKMIRAILEQGAPAYNTPSGPVLELLSELARKGAIREMSIAYLLFSKARPGNSRFVAESIPGKISANYFSRTIDMERFNQWSRSNPNWKNALKESLVRPDAFEGTVKRMIDEMGHI